jgi:hypothetical protein
LEWTIEFLSALLPNMDSKPNERIAEVAAILADGLQRVLARQSSAKAPGNGESSLSILPDQSGGRPIPENGEPQ